MRIFYLTYFFLQHKKKSSVKFYVHIKIGKPKILHVHFYIASETEKKGHHCQLSGHKLIQETEKLATINYIDITEYAYFCGFFFSILSSIA